MIKPKKILIAIFGFLLLLYCSFISAQTKDYKPGVDRWKIKTSVMDNTVKKTVSLNDLLMLQKPISKYSKIYEDKRISKKVNPGGLKEGDIVTTKGWLKLVALEDNSKTHRDGDYHIQLVPGADMSDSCFIVEVPYPDFVSDPVLRKECADVRSFIRERLLKGKEPSKRGSIMIHNVYVKVTGQLFFDAVHLNEKPRGKRGMHSYTEWELHPIMKIEFAPVPKQ